MDCREAVYSENVLEYFVGSYRGENYIQEMYQPDCYFPIDVMQGVIYKNTDVIDGDAIERYGFSAIPNVYGLMSQEALEASGVLRIRRQPYLDLYGQGVLIGFVDTGIDYRHEAFIAADGTTRIVSLWDQTVEEGEGTGEFPYGEEYKRDRINQALMSERPLEIVPSIDESGHGTFLAGVAAGNENRSEEFSGVAPLAELVVVKCKQAKKSYRDYYGIPDNVPAFQENDIMTGLAYILGVAGRENRPVVLCLGLGSNMGNHNSGTPLGQYLTRYGSIYGSATVVCAGNEGNARHHYRIQSEEETVSVNVERENPGFMMQLWWQKPGQLSLDVISPSGEVFLGIQATTGTKRRYEFRPEGTNVEISFGVSQFLTNEQVVVFRFGNVREGIWKIRVRAQNANPDFSLWLPIRNFMESDVYFLGANPDQTITNPGTTGAVVTTTAYDVRDGALYLQAGRGFTPNGTVKPDVALPGEEILGTFPRGRYGTMSGSSVSAAFGAGIGALFMQQYGGSSINSTTMRELFIRGAVPRGMPYPNQEWGFGIANAYQSITDY